eukprot:gene36619-45165_t
MSRDSVLLSRARVQMETTAFKSRMTSQLLASPDQTLSPLDEVEAASLVLRGYLAHLAQDTNDFCWWLSERMSDEKYFKQHVAKLLPCRYL